MAGKELSTVPVMKCGSWSLTDACRAKAWCLLVQFTLRGNANSKKRSGTNYLKCIYLTSAQLDCERISTHNY
jgi:hypothetical protein